MALPTTPIEKRTISDIPDAQFRKVSNMLHTKRQPAVWLFSIGMIGLGTLSVISRDFAFDWQPVPPFHPGREVLAVFCGLFMIASSIALLFRATAALASR